MLLLKTDGDSSLKGSSINSYLGKMGGYILMGQSGRRQRTRTPTSDAGQHFAFVIVKRRSGWSIQHLFNSRRYQCENQCTTGTLHRILQVIDKLAPDPTSDYYATGIAHRGEGALLECDVADSLLASLRSEIKVHHCQAMYISSHARKGNLDINNDVLCRTP